jgi:RecA-family ATPase
MRSGSGSAGSTGWNNSVRWRGYLERVLEVDGTEHDNSRRVLRTKKANYGANGGEIELRWQSGCFHVAGSGSGEAVAAMDPLWREKRADRVFLDRLRWHIEHNDLVSMSKRGGLYAPEVFRKEAALQGVTRSELEAAMSRLLDRKEIENVPFGARSRGYYRLFIPGMSACI